MSQEGNKTLIHEFIVIGNSEHDNPGSLERAPVVLAQFFAMDALHHEDQVGPFHLLVREPDLGVSIQACRVHRNPRLVGEDVLGSGAAELVL